MSLEETKPCDCLVAKGKEGNSVEKQQGAKGRMKFQKFLVLAVGKGGRAVASSFLRGEAVEAPLAQAAAQPSGQKEQILM